MLAPISCLLSLAIFLVVGGLLILPLFCRWRWKLLYLLLTAAAACKIQILYLLGGRESYFTPHLAPEILIPANWVWLVIFFYAILLLLLSLPLGLLRLTLFRKAEKQRWRRLGNRLRVGLLVITAGTVSVGMYNSLQLPEVNAITIELPKLPAETAPLRIALLADLHADDIADAAFMQGVVDITNAQKPDVIAIAGDFVDGTVEQFGAHLEPLRGLKAPLGVYAVGGNHDVYSGLSEWEHFLSACGIRFLNNENVRLSDTLYLAGVRDEAERRFSRCINRQPHYKQALSGAPAGSATILLAHQPATFVHPDNTADLQLSGHTHGGMMPGVRELIALANKGFVVGLYRRSERQLYVSRGTRLWSGWLFRLFNSPEITIITIKAQAHEHTEKTE